MGSASSFWTELQKWPHLYLSAPTLTALSNFVAGWKTAVRKNGGDEVRLDLPPDFNDWVAYRERFDESGRGWRRMLLEKHDEEAAFQRFFILLDEHQRRVPHEFGHIDGVVRVHEYHLTGAGFQRIEESGRLSLWVYTDDPGFFSHHAVGPPVVSDEFHFSLKRWARFMGERALGLVITDPVVYARLLQQAEDIQPSVRTYIPRDKGDVETAEVAIQAGYPAVEPVLDELLVWLQDRNWPVSQPLIPFFASIGAPLAPHLRRIFEGDDYVWQHNVCYLISESPALYELLGDVVRRIAHSPTKGEREEELHLVCADIIACHEA